MKKITVALVSAFILANASPFDQGKMNLSLNASQSGSNTLLGIGANFFIANGLTVGAEYRGTFGSNISRNEVNIPVNFYVPLPGPIRPYIGGFYRVSVDNDSDNDYDVYGGRIGISTIQGRGYLNAGYVQEWSSRGGETVSNGRPEITAGISF